MGKISSSSDHRSNLVITLRDFHKKAQSKIQPTTSFSYLEQLPNELIQHIFFHCFEVNLPRCSLRLAKALSTNAIYNTLILFAYFDDDEFCPVEETYFLPAVYRPLALAEKLRLQRAILACRWCTLERIRTCLPTLSRLRMVQEWYKERDEEKRFESDLEATDEVKLIVPNDALRQVAPLPGLHDHDEMIRHFLAKAEYRSSAQAAANVPDDIVISETYLPRIVRWSLTDVLHRGSGVVEAYKTIDAKVSILAARVLPEKLVRGCPWTPGKVELLQLLRQGSKSISKDHVLEVSAAAVFDGMLGAIEEKNVPALLTLLELHNDVFEKVSQDQPESRLTPPTYHPLPIQLFHAATKMGAQSSQFVWLLVRAGVDSIPKDDDILTAWALQVQAQDNHDRVAAWLLNHMAGTNDYHLGRRGYLFVNGSLSWRVSDGLFPPAQHQFARELGYLEGGQTFIPTSPDGSPCG